MTRHLILTGGTIKTSYPPLTEEEFEISNTINQDKISYLILADGTDCVKKYTGTFTEARIDEYDPVNPSGPDEWGFIVMQAIYVVMKIDLRLYGDFFYQDGTWWTFVELSEEEINLDEPWERMELNVWKFATRFKVAPDTFKGNYTCRADADYAEKLLKKKN